MNWTLSSLNTKLDTYTTVRWAIAMYFLLHFGVELSPFFLPWRLEYLSVVFQEALIYFFVLFIFWVVAPFRAKYGLFWVPSFDRDQENHSAWLEATQRALDQVRDIFFYSSFFSSLLTEDSFQITSEEHQEYQSMVSAYNQVAKNLQLVQYLSVEKKEENEEKKEEDSDDEVRVANVYLASKLGWNVSLSPEEGEEYENESQVFLGGYGDDGDDEDEAEEGTPLIASYPDGL